MIKKRLNKMSSINKYIKSLNNDDKLKKMVSDWKEKSKNHIFDYSKKICDKIKSKDFLKSEYDMLYSEYILKKYIINSVDEKDKVKVERELFDFKNLKFLENELESIKKEIRI